MSFIEQVNDRGKEPILDVINAIGKWPMLEGKNWDESKWEWKDSILKFRKVVSKKEDIFTGKETNNEVDTVGGLAQKFK